MANELTPEPEQWYRDMDEQTDFRVLSVDEDQGTIDVEAADGHLETMELEEWEQLNLQAVDAPLFASDELDELDEEVGGDWRRSSEDEEDLP